MIIRSFAPIPRIIPHGFVLLFYLYGDAMHVACLCNN